MAAPMNITTVQAVIAGGQSLSAEADIGPGVLVGIIIPTGWTAAALTFQASVDGVTWAEMVNATDTAMTFGPVTAGQYVAVDPTLWRGVAALKLRSGTLGTPVVQGSQQTLTLVTKVLA